MIVNNCGYLKYADVVKLIEESIKFGLYKTAKKTIILVKTNQIEKYAYLYRPKEDRLPYKLVEGKNITHGQLIFDSTCDSIDKIDVTTWNGGNQIMSYTDSYQIYW